MSYPTATVERNQVTAEILAGLPLFNGEDCGVLEWAAASMAIRLFEAGTVLLDPEYKNDSLFIILSGRASVRLQGEDESPPLYLGPGECVGEISVLEGGHPSAMVVLDSPGQVLVMSQDMVWDLVDRSHVFARNLLHILSARMRKNNRALVESHIQQRKHEQFAFVDALTGLYNRRWLDNNLPRIVERCVIDMHPLALLIVDTDNFKRYNDNYGHLAGDDVLKSIAESIKGNVRALDQACRYGGDEFVVVLPNANTGQATRVAERLCAAVRQQTLPMSRDSFFFPLSVSIGVAAFESGIDIGQLFKNADAALYRAKAAGRNRVSR